MLIDLCGPDTIIYSASELRNKDAWDLFYDAITQFFDAERVDKKLLPQFEETQYINVFLMTKKKK